MSLNGPGENNSTKSESNAGGPATKDQAPPPSDMKDDAFGEAMRRFGDAAMDMGEQLYEATGRGMQRLGKNIQIGATHAAEVGSRVVTNIGEGVGKIGETTKRWSGEAATGLLEFLGKEPGLDPTFKDKLMQQAPVIGSLKSYADAWKSYHAGMRGDDAAMMTEARRQCLKTFMQVGVDIAVLGGSKLATAGNIVKKLGFGLTLTRVVGSVADKLKIDLNDKLVDGVLNSEQSRRIVDSFFELVTPTEGKPASGEKK